MAIIVILIIGIFLPFNLVSSEGNFKTLQDQINSSESTIDITQDYKYDNSTDHKLNKGIIIKKSNIVINGNGHTIDGSDQSRIFNITGKNITIRNLNFINGNSGKDNGGAILTSNLTKITNCTFNNTNAKWGGGVYSLKDLNMTNSTFVNSKAYYSPAIYAQKNASIINSSFENLYANETSGAIGLRELKNGEINNCTFINITSNKNGGAIAIDANINSTTRTYIANSKFFNSQGNFGGALIQYCGNLTIENSIFKNNTATYDGAAIYASNLDFNMTNCTFESNKIQKQDSSNGGTIYCDMVEFNSLSSNFTNNSKNAIYAYDSYLNITDNNFKNNQEAVHSTFSETTLTNINHINDNLVLNDTSYNTSVSGNGVELKLINKSVNTDSVPSHFDLRDYGWVTPIKIQGDANSCWAFGSYGALESALLKATGIGYNFSESSMVNAMLQYSKYGLSEDADDGGYSDWALKYLLSWLGPVPVEDESYDEFGRISPILNTTQTIHIQDAKFIKPRENLTDNDEYKKAMMKYGALDISYTNFENAPYYNNKTAAQYQNISKKQDHEVTLIGWDDNYSASNFLITPPGDGAWIIKNSWDKTWGKEGYGYVSYYDIGIFNYTYTVAYVIENTENYTTNYQTDISGNLTMEKNGTSSSYSNTYKSNGDELISGVGTYFSEEGEEYSLEIYVNGKLKHTQNGNAPYYGFHTVKLNKEIPIEHEDTFKVVMKKKSIPTLSYSRQHYLKNMSFVNYGDGWKDISLDNKTVSLKVYTKNQPHT